MKVAELVELLKTMPQDADVATVTKLGNGMFSAICNAIKYDGHDAFGDYTMVILENGTYPTILPNKVNHTPGILEWAKKKYDSASSENEKEHWRKCFPELFEK